MHHKIRTKLPLTVCLAEKNQTTYETWLKNIQLTSSNASPYTYIFLSRKCNQLLDIFIDDNYSTALVNLEKYLSFLKIRLIFLGITVCCTSMERKLQKT